MGFGLSALIACGQHKLKPLKKKKITTKKWLNGTTTDKLRFYFTNILLGYLYI